ncbi:MAG: CBS domain-containing protein [Planctomycetota bacterium]|nr:CBS domain-containing protein [Planctomycetota bacterium]
MQRKVPSLSPDHSVAEAAMQMVDQRRNRLPVVDGEGKLLGEVVWNDLIGKMLTK